MQCDEYYTFRDESGRFFCKVDGRDFYTNEYFRTLKRNRSIVIYGASTETESDTSDEYLGDVFDRIFFVSSTTSEDE